MDFDKLTRDACQASRMAHIAAAATDDGGTCNQDAAFFPMQKGQRSAPCIEALRKAGLSAYASRWIGRGIMVYPPAAGQANKRAAANEAFTKSMSDSGWNVLPYYQTD